MVCRHDASSQRADNIYFRQRDIQFHLLFPGLMDRLCLADAQGGQERIRPAGDTISLLQRPVAL